MGNGKYILKDGSVERVDDLLMWSKWIGQGNRHIKNDKIGDVSISTVFLGLDHKFGEGEPLLFETMIFGGEHDQYQERYTNIEDSKIGHDKAVKLVKGGR